MRMSTNELKSDRRFLARCATLLDTTIFVCLMAVIAFTVIPYGTVDAWWEAFFECAVFGITAAWICEVLFRGQWGIGKLSILLPAILITAYIFAQSVVWPNWLPIGTARLSAQHALTIDRYQTYLTARKALALTLFLGLLLLHTSSPRRFRSLVHVVIGVGLGSALFGIIRQFLQTPDSPAGFVLPFLFYGTGYGQFISPNVFAYLMEMVFALVAGLVLGGGLRRNRIPIYLAFGVLVWTALVLSNSRGSILGLSVQSILLLLVSLNWYSKRQRSTEKGTQPKWLTFLGSSALVRVPLTVLIVATLFVGVLWMGGERLASKLQSADSLQDTIDGTTRHDIWRSSWRLIKDQPWTGVGFGSYFLAIPQYQTGAGRLKLEQAHNDYLDLTANGGVVAVVLAAWFAAWLIRRSIYCFRSADAYRRAACLGATAGIVSIAVHSLVDFGLQITGIAVVFIALIVILVADNRVNAVSPENNAALFPYDRRARAVGLRFDSEDA